MRIYRIVHAGPKTHDGGLSAGFINMSYQRLFIYTFIISDVIIKTMQPLISWDSPEHIHIEKSNDWYWAVGIVSITAVALCFIFGNIIFGVFIIVGIFALLVHSSRKPNTVHCEINDRGITIDSRLYSFLSLESFWIDSEREPKRLIIKSLKTFMPYLIVHLVDIDSEEIRTVLLDYIAETEHHEPLSQQIFERLGF